MTLSFHIPLTALLVCALYATPEVHALTSKVPPKAAANLIPLALLIGNNAAGKRAKPLRFAQSDARKMRSVLVQAAGYKADNIWLLLGKGASDVRRAMVAIKARIQKLKQKHGRSRNILLLLYYSGHARRGKLLLGASQMPFKVLRRFLHKAGADLRLAIVDACESGPLTRQRGLRHRKRSFPIPLVHVAPTVKGEVLISATGSKESAHEDPELRGGVFTHYLVSRLRGAADRNNDGHVTLEEIYQYTYTRSLERTLLSVHGPQRAHFRKQLSGYGQLILTSLSRPQAWIVLRHNVKGDIFVWDQRKKTLLAELNKDKGRAAMLALTPGRYVIQWRHRGSLYATDVQLRRGQRLRLRQKGRRIAYWRKGVSRGSTQGSLQGDWIPFSPEVGLHSLSALYQTSFGGVSRGALLHGPGLHMQLSLAALGFDKAALSLQLLYQASLEQAPADFPYSFHLFHLELGLNWAFLRHPSFQLQAGFHLRLTPVLQVIPPKRNPAGELVRAGDTILSFSPGAGIAMRMQWNFSPSWFVHAQLDSGVQIFQLSSGWNPRWQISLAVGLGLRL